MARTKSEILETLIETKDDNSVLSAILTSNSKAAFWYNLFSLYAEVTGDLEETFDDLEDTIEDLLDEKQVMTKYWWQQLCLAYQEGYSLSIDDNGNLYYATTDEDAQIIQRCAVVVTDNGAITLKVAALDSSDEPTALTTAQKTSFASYIDDAGPAGIVPTIVTVAGDELQIEATITVDTQLLSPTDGSLLTDSSTFPVEDAINDYIADFQDDNFGGTFYYSKLLKAILNATGVINVEITVLNYKSASDSSFSDLLSEDGKKFTATSGYVVLEDGWTLSDYLTYESE